MDRFSFQEAVLADYIQVLQSYSREELLSELLDVKYGQLEKLSDEALLVELNEQRKKQRKETSNMLILKNILAQGIGISLEYFLILLTLLSNLGFSLISRSRIMMP